MVDRELKTGGVVGIHGEVIPHVPENEQVFAVPMVGVEVRVAKSELDLIKRCVSHRHGVKVIQLRGFCHSVAFLCP